MKLAALMIGVSMALAAPAAATVVTVESTAGPWDVVANPTLDYGAFDSTGPTAIAVNAGDNLTISWLSGLTNAFSGGSPIADGNGYVGGVFGSGPGLTGQGSAAPLPSSFIDPTNAGPDNIWLNELIGAFADSTGKLVSDPFAIGNGLSISASAGATQLLLGLNDDLFGDNSGALQIEVLGSTAGAVPEPASWTLMIGGFGLAGGMMRRRATKVAFAL